VLFFYPILAQKPLLQGLSRTFSRKGIPNQLHSSPCKQARKAKLLPAPVFLTPPRSKWRILELCQIVCLGLLQPLDHSSQTYAVLRPSAIAVFANRYIRATDSGNGFKRFLLANKRSKFIAQVLKVFYLLLKLWQLFSFPCQLFCAASDQFLQIGLKFLIHT